MRTTGAATDDDGNPVQEGEEQDPTWVRPAPVLTDEDMGMEEIEQGQTKWENFEEYYSIFHNDPSLMNSLAKEVGDGRPVADAGGTKSLAGGICSQCFIASLIANCAELVVMWMYPRRRSWGGKSRTV